MSLHAISPGSPLAGTLLHVGSTESSTSVLAGAAEASLGVDVTFVADGVSTYLAELFIPAFHTFATGDHIATKLREDPAGANTDCGMMHWVGVTTGTQLLAGGLGRIARVPAAGSRVWRPVVWREAGSNASDTVDAAAVGGGNGRIIRMTVWRIAP